MNNWPQMTKGLSAQLRGGATEVMKAFAGMVQAAAAAKALDAKTKELIALGIGVAVRCDDWIAFHVKAASSFLQGQDSRATCGACVKAASRLHSFCQECITPLLRRCDRKGIRGSYR
jgi:alkylhydroperoxidase family enzyme